MMVEMNGTLILMLIGTVMTFLPVPVWFVCYGWRHPEKQVPDDILVGLRLGGMALIVIGMIFLFFSAF